MGELNISNNNGTPHLSHDTIKPFSYFLTLSATLGRQPQQRKITKLEDIVFHFVVPVLLPDRLIVQYYLAKGESDGLNIIAIKIGKHLNGVTPVDHQQIAEDVVRGHLLLRDYAVIGFFERSLAQEGVVT